MRLEEVEADRNEYLNVWQRQEAGSGLEWTVPPPVVALEPGAIHVWHVSLQAIDAGTANLELTLDLNERGRARRFRFERDRARFVITRFCLRVLLGEYLGLNPKDVSLTYSKYGKPSVCGTSACPAIEFNVSHAEDHAILAFSVERKVGVDVELVRNDFSSDEIARQFFSRSEIDALRSVADSERPRAFFSCWTRKEAYIKARGEGLSRPLDSFAVSLLPGEPAALLRSEADPSDLVIWHYIELPSIETYESALVVERGVDLSVGYFAFDRRTGSFDRPS